MGIIINKNFFFITMDLMRDAVVKDLMRDAVVKNDNMRDAIVKDDNMRDAVVKNDFVTHEAAREWSGVEDKGHPFVHPYYHPYAYYHPAAHVDQSEACQEHGNCKHFTYNMMRD